MGTTEAGDKAAAAAMLPSLGEHIKRIRRERGLTQEKLAGPEFTKGYVSALERGSVRPSIKALDIFARRLGVSIVDFLEAPQELRREADLKAQEEDFLYNCNYAKMLMRAGKVDEALRLVGEIEQSAQSYRSLLQPGVAYLLPLLRGRGYLQLMTPKEARRELEEAVRSAAGDAEATARARNLLGVALFELGLPQLALAEHLACLQGVHAHALNDPNLRVSIHRNLANDYWALNEPERAADIYREALPYLENLNDMEQQARVFWGMSMAYARLKEQPQAKLYALRALHIFEAADNRAEAASICLSLADVVLGQEKYEEAAQLLERAGRFALGTGNLAAMSYLYRTRADLARRQGEQESALLCARESVEAAKRYYDAARSDEGQGSGAPKELSSFWQDPERTYAEALQMEALVEEARGLREPADELFKKALALVEAGGFEETRHAISFSYAEMLKARGDFEGAMNYYRSSAQFRPSSTPVSAG